tara:strand:- start:238 stop:384 length:147 start_codon:yes stop_codon:yes gene_type:complete
MNKLSFAKIAMSIGLGVFAYENKNKLPPVDDIVEFLIYPINYQERESE